MAVFVFTPMLVLLFIGIAIGTAAAAKYRGSRYVAPIPSGPQPGTFAWTSWWVIRWAVCCFLLVLMEKARPPASIFLFGGAAVLAAFTARDGIRRWRLGAMPPPPSMPGQSFPPPLPPFHYGPPPVPRRRGRGLAIAGLVVGAVAGAGLLIGIASTDGRPSRHRMARYDMEPAIEAEFQEFMESGSREAQLGLREGKLEISRAMQEATREFQSGMKHAQEAIASAASSGDAARGHAAEIKNAVAAAKGDKRTPPPTPQAPPAVALQSPPATPAPVALSPAQGVKGKRNGAPSVRTAPKPPEPLVGTRIAADSAIEDLAKLPTDGVIANRYLIEANQNQGPGHDSYQLQLRQMEARAEVLLANHLYAMHRVSSEEWTKPNANWLYAKGVLRQLHGPNQLELMVTPENVEMVYNFHLGARRTLDLAAVYLGGLLLLGGSAMLLRIGTGLRAKPRTVHKT